jgi:hypothetical protein
MTTSKMIELVDEMRARLTEIAEREQTLIRALGEALTRVDHRLLQDVRSITSEHEARRGAILTELQGLASRIGAFPAVPREPVAQLNHAEPAPALRPLAAANDRPPIFGRGDWRKATRNIEDELDIYFKDRAASH